MSFTSPETGASVSLFTAEDDNVPELLRMPLLIKLDFYSTRIKIFSRPFVHSAALSMVRGIRGKTASENGVGDFNTPSPSRC